MIELIAYCLIFGFLKVIALLPFRVLYLLADVLYVLLFHIVRYRRKVVTTNLAESFPEKSVDEIHTISRQFYRNFADYIVETIKLLHISDRQICERMRFENLEAVKTVTEEGRSAAIFFSHCGNWEWAPSVTLHLPHTEAGSPVDFCQVYRPLRNLVFDRLMLRIRSRFGSISLPKDKAIKSLFNFKRHNIITVTGFMSDQKPSHGDPTEITMFLNHPTAIIAGTERLARHLGMAAIYWDVYKPKRGHYIIKCVPMAADVADTEQGSVTRLYSELLQATIRRNPSIWLWTHKRWKIPVEMPGLQ